MATLAVKLHKPLSARLLPVADKKPGDRTEFHDPSCECDPAALAVDFSSGLYVCGGGF
jgi:Uncharacterised ACR (DUF711)